MCNMIVYRAIVYVLREVYVDLLWYKDSFGNIDINLYRYIAVVMATNCLCYSNYRTCKQDFHYKSKNTLKGTRHTNCQYRHIYEPLITMYEIKSN